MANTTANLGQTDFLRISPARMDQAFQPPRINDMNEGEVQAIVHGNKVFVFIAGRMPNDAPQLLSTDLVPLKALAVIAPVVNRALAAHNKNNPSTINNIILPGGGLRAYSEFLLWVHDVLRAGKLVSLRDLQFKPLTCYSELVFIANRLRIAYLAAGLRRRIQGILTVSADKKLSIDPGDIRDAADHLPQGHWLIAMMVNAIAFAEMNGWLQDGFKAVLQVLYAEVNGLKIDVERRKVELEQMAQPART